MFGLAPHKGPACFLFFSNCLYTAMYVSLKQQFCKRQGFLSLVLLEDVTLAYDLKVQGSRFRLGSRLGLGTIGLED